MRCFICIAAAVLVLTVNAAHCGGDDKREVIPTFGRGGVVAYNANKTAAPGGGFLTTEKEFYSLLDAWDAVGQFPKVDFEKQFALIHLSAGPNSLMTVYWLDVNGDLTADATQTLIDGPGFGYRIDIVDRKGVKSYRGKPIE
jgi:hypothetical protein